MSHDQTVLAMGLSYTLVGLTLLILLVFARLDWRMKAGLIVLMSAFYIVDYQGARSLLGWASPEALPPNFKLLGARIVEPHSLAGDAGAIFLWVEEIDARNFPSGDPRLYRLAYDVKLAERTEAAVKASAEGKPQGGRTADTGAGTGGAVEATQREVTPSTLTVTSGGDPMSGGPADPQVSHEKTHGVVFAPLLPPHLPPKDTQ
jgi:hypothetical protein